MAERCLARQSLDALDTSLQDVPLFFDCRIMVLVFVKVTMMAYLVACFVNGFYLLKVVVNHPSRDEAFRRGLHEPAPSGLRPRRGSHGIDLSAQG